MDSGGRTCTKCGLLKPRSEFYADPNRSDGLRSHCKGCVKQQSTAHYAANKPQPARPDRQLTPVAESRTASNSEGTSKRAGGGPQKVNDFSIRAAANATHPEHDSVISQIRADRLVGDSSSRPISGMFTDDELVATFGWVHGTAVGPVNAVLNAREFHRMWRRQLRRNAS